MLIKGSIGLGIRERKPVSNPEQYSTQSLSQWIAALPKANIGETSRQIYQLIHDSNKLLLSPEQRNCVIASISETSSFITDSMRKHYIGTTVALSNKQQKIANFSQALDVEIAIAYKTIIEDLIIDEKFQNKLLTRAINACMHYFFKIQTRCYQLYRDLPTGMWHEIHLLYQLAEQNQFHDETVNLGQLKLCIKATYKNILLLATVNPNQLRQQEISQIASSMSKASRLVKIDSDPDAEHDFLVNLKSDSGPFHQSLMNNEIKGHYRGISLAEVIETLEQELQHKVKEQRLLKLDDQTQRHLLNSWGTMTTRTFARVDGSGHLTVTVGLAASHYLINTTLYGEESEYQELTGDKLIDSLEGSLKNAVVLGEDDGMVTRPGLLPKRENSPPTMSDKSMWDALYRNQAVQDKQNEKVPYQFMENSSEESNSIYSTQEATIINISPGGFCLQLDAPLPKQTQTGEIIGLLEYDTEDQIHWNIGTIRWMRRKQAGELELGVQLIAPNAAPVRAQLRTSHSSDNNYQRSLQLPAIESIGQPETLLTSILPFREQAKVRIQTPEGTQDLMLLNEVASGHSFKQFTYEILDSAPDGDMKDKNDDFDAVWKLI